MIRNVSLEEISDGKLYTCRDMVKVDANDCAGCSGCCRGMGNSILLDPLDVFRLQKHTGQSFGEMMSQVLELNVVDGLVLPNLKMQDQTDACIFLSPQQRCTIHPVRPGFCRLFPLGRYYENDTFYYINQIHECGRAGRTKIRISRWLGQEDMKSYEAFCLEWHRVQKEAQGICEKLTVEQARTVNMYLLKMFFMSPYDTGQDFYYQFAARLTEVRANLAAFEAAL